MYRKQIDRMLNTTLTGLAFAVSFTGAVEAQSFGDGMRLWFGDKFSAQPAVRVNSDDPTLKDYKQIGNFAIGAAPFSTPDKTLIFYAPIGAFKDVKGQNFEGVIALPDGKTEMGATCAFIGAATGNVIHLGDNGITDRVIIQLSESEIDLVEETGCLAIQRRSGNDLKL